MIPLEVILISAFFPLIGMISLLVCKVRNADWSTATALGLVGTLLIGAVFYDAGIFQYFVPSMACLLAVLSFAALNSASMVGFINKPSPRLLLAVLAFGCIAVIGRLPVSNFIFEIGDAGGYVNSANHLVWAGTTTTQFFPLSQVLLGIFAFTGGAALTPYGVLVASVAGTWFAVLLGRAYFGGWREGWLVGAIVALNVLAMWFGRLPYSESLMLACNLGALAYWKLAVASRLEHHRYYILFGLFVAAASLTRVTGIIWMLVLSGTLLFLCIRRSEHLRPFVLAFIIAAVGYAVSVQIALDWGPNYYINWQLRSFLPWLKTAHSVILFHIAWLIVLTVCAVASYWLAPRLRIPKWVKKRSDVWIFVIFVGFLFLTTVHFVDNWHHWLIIGAINRLVVGKYPEDSYYLENYFTFLSIPLFFAGWYFLFRKWDPFKHESWILFWLFSVLYLMISYIRPTYGRSHDVYMYWDRYFVSDTFIVFVVVIAAGIIFCLNNKLAKWFAMAFIGVYIAQAVIWIGSNRGSKYLSGGYDMIAWLEASIPKTNSIVFLDDQYGGGWVFPNLRRTILAPLAHSFGYDTSGHGTGPGPFSADAPLDRAAVAEAMENGKQVYIIHASSHGTSKPFASYPFPVDIVERRAFLISAKPSLEGRVFAGGRREYPIALTIGHVWSKSVDLESLESTGMYADHIWTDGNGVFKNLNVCPPQSHAKVVVSTYGYVPATIAAGEINLEISVNGIPLHGKWLSRTRYVADIPGLDQCIHTMAFRSATFIPKKLGINNDARRLGIDLKSVVVQ